MIRSDLIYRKFSGLLIVIGSLLFVYGGAIQPHISSSMGTLGSAEFFENFRMTIAGRPQRLGRYGISLP